MSYASGGSLKIYQPMNRLSLLKQLGFYFSGDDILQSDVKIRVGEEV